MPAQAVAAHCVAQVPGVLHAQSSNAFWPTSPPGCWVAQHWKQAAPVVVLEQLVVVPPSVPPLLEPPLLEPPLLELDPELPPLLEPPELLELDPELPLLELLLPLLPLLPLVLPLPEPPAVSS